MTLDEADKLIAANPGAFTIAFEGRAWNRLHPEYPIRDILAYYENHKLVKVEPLGA